MISQMTSPPAYSLAERDRRWTLANDMMERLELDALLVYGEHEDAGPAPFNFDTWFTNDRAGTTVLMCRGELPVSFVPMPLYLLDRLETERRGGHLWIPVSNILVGRDAKTLAEFLQKNRPEISRIGVIGLAPYMPWHPEGVIPYGFVKTLNELFPEITLVPVGEVFEEICFRLSAEQIKVIRHSATIGDAMVDAMVNVCRPGTFESELYAAGTHAALLHGTTVPGMHLWSGAEFAASGPPSWTYRPSAVRELKSGDVVMAEVFSHYGMLHTQHQVTIAIGEVHEDIERAAAIARECYLAGLRVIRPGVKFRDVVEAMLAPAEASGGWVRGPQIHSLNPFTAISGVPPDCPRVDGLEQYPALASIPVLRPDMEICSGMSFAFEPSCGFGRNVVTLGGTVVVSETGVLELNPNTSQLLRVQG
ncbi:M24 family metallopeptidase [Citrobacter sp. wls619]|uniref:M24 family peptidase n=1 Tax=Citrobacter sp. wls619 TaxID=2576432 RepID=UPI0010C9DDE2|nr:M24 family peptidase [Citrobacter sp. wls619]TKV07671.1 M24 family metallopeptidase [Citrobacter sp. wls619]